MQTFKNVLMTTIFMVVSIMTFAKPYAFDLRIEKLSAKAFVVLMDNTQEGEVKISIVDQEGYQVHQPDISRTAQISKKYKLDRLPSGRYDLKIECNNSILIQPFSIKNGHVIIEEDTRNIIYKPEFTLLQDNVYIDLYLLKKGKTTIKLYDRTGRVLVNESFSKDGSLQRKYNLSKLKKGAYTVSVLMNGETFTEDVKVE